MCHPPISLSKKTCDRQLIAFVAGQFGIRVVGDLAAASLVVVIADDVVRSGRPLNQDAVGSRGVAGDGDVSARLRAAVAVGIDVDVRDSARRRNVVAFDQQAVDRAAFVDR